MDEVRAAMRVGVVVPNLDGERWLPALLDSLAAQTAPPTATLVVDNGSRDGSRALLAERGVPTLALAHNHGFAAAVDRGIAALPPGVDAVALVNTDVALAPDWIRRTAGRLAADPGAAAVATKMTLLREDPRGTLLDDCGDVLRRDGVAEQRGHGHLDGPRFDGPDEVWGACAGAALYRRSALEAVGGFDERFFAYLEDVDLALRLRLAGWRCLYEPAVARHARHGSAGRTARTVDQLVARNTLLIVAKAFPARWLPLVAYRQVAWLVAATREGRLREHLGGVAAALPLLPAMLRERRTLRAAARVPIERAVPARPWRGPRAGGHPRARE